ncbi:Hypothetical predicted protein, partial [Marmota monax]
GVQVQTTRKPKAGPRDKLPDFYQASSTWNRCFPCKQSTRLLQPPALPRKGVSRAAQEGDSGKVRRVCDSVVVGTAKVGDSSLHHLLLPSPFRGQQDRAYETPARRDVPAP